MRRVAVPLLAGVFLLGAAPCRAAPVAVSATERMVDCVARAAIHHRVPAELLMAIAWQESRLNPHAVNVNRNASIDLGMMQINSIHWKDLARHGIRPVDLLDPCISVFVGAWLLRRNIDVYGPNWQAIGAYHSATPALRDAYARQISRLVR